MSLFGRDEKGPSRSRRTRRAKERAQASRLPRHAIEELETRVLLSGFGPDHRVHVFEFELPSPSAMVSSSPSPVFLGQPKSLANDGVASVASGLDTQWSSNSANETATVPTNQSLLLLLQHSSLRYAGSTGTEGVDGGPAGPFNGENTSRTFVQPGGGSSTSSDGADLSSKIKDAVLAATDGSVTTSTAVFLIPSSSGSGWVALQSNVPDKYTPTSNSFDGPQVPVPLGPTLAEMRGTLDGQEPAMTYDIPIGPMTQSLGLTVRPTAGMPPGEIPVVDEMSLVDSTGKTLEQVGSAGGTAGFLSPSVFVQLHGAPAGDRIEVQITAAEPPASTSSSTSSTSSASVPGAVTPLTSSQPANWSVSFILDVQRQQSSTSSSDGSSTVSGPETVGTLIVAPAQEPSAFASSSSSSVTTGQDGSTSLDAQSTSTNTAVAVADTPATNVATDSTESINLRVPTGPLASRGGGALGPTLALIDAEPTQPVDRLERALSQEIVGLGIGDGELTASNDNGAHDQEFADDPGTWPVSIGTAGTGGPVVSIPGRGGFPLKVTSLGRDQRVQFAALWQTLPAVPGPDSSVTNTALSANSPTELPIAAAVAVSPVPENLECPDYVKAACGLAIGLGLTAGPLFPDLVASLPGRLPKWFSIFKAQHRRRDVARDSKSVSRRKMPNWLRALFVSR